MKLPALILLAIALSCSCRKIPDPPVTSQSMGVPMGSGNSTVSFYSSSTTRTYQITVDGAWQGTFTPATQSPVCNGQGTLSFSLDAGLHSFSGTWSDSFMGGTGSVSGSFTLTEGDCILYPL